jgi:hypothetical protein
MSDLITTGVVIVSAAVLRQLTTQHRQQAAERRANRAAAAERRRREQRERRGELLQAELAEMIGQLDAFAQSAAGEHAENDLQSIRTRLTALGGGALREEGEIAAVARQLKEIRRLLKDATARANAGKLTSQVEQQQIALSHLKHEAAACRLLSLRFDPDGLRNVETLVGIVESHLKRRNLAKAQQEMARLQESFARHRALVEREQSQRNSLQEEATTALAVAQERLASMQVDELVRRWCAPCLEALARRVEQCESGVPAGRCAQVHQECKAIIAEADKLVAAAEEMQRCQEERNYVTKSMREILAEFGFRVEEFPAEQPSADARILATRPDGRAITVTVPLKGSLEVTTEGFTMEVFTGNDSQPARACKEAAKQIEAVVASLSEMYGVEIGELTCKRKDPDRPSKAAKRLPCSTPQRAQRTREA